MTSTRAFLAALSVAAATVAGTGAAQAALKDEVSIRNGIIYVGMAYEISRKCDSIDARTWRGIGYLQSLKNEASALGYSNAEIDAYVDDRAEKRRLEGIARSQLNALGVVEGDEATYCAVGRAQMAANTRVGWLLR